MRATCVLRRRPRRHDPPRRCDPVEDGHPDIHQGDVGPVRPRFGHGVLAVGRLGDDEPGAVVDNVRPSSAVDHPSRTE
jgi:hypothetical protein